MIENQQPTIISNRYQIRSRIGEGGMGVVYRVFDRLARREVALKTINATPLDDSAVTDYHVAIAQEFRFLSSLRHPNIISVLDYGFDHEQQPFFTMELLNNPAPFIDALFKHPFAEQLKLIAQLLQALVYLHRRGILHRDLKHENVLVISDGTPQVKVLDFGMAVAREQMQTEDERVTGTMGFIAPELLLGGTPSPASDLYAVGVMHYEVLTGQHPLHLDYDNITRLIRMIIEEPPDPTLLDAYPSVKATVLRLLEKWPSTRFQTAQEVLYALQRDSGLALVAENDVMREGYLQGSAFIGRNAELQILLTALQNAIGGSGSAWLLGGESGVGKSRLLSELEQRALVGGVLVLHGEAISEGGALNAVLRQPLRQLCLNTDLTPDEAATLSALVPDIAILREQVIAEPLMLQNPAQAHQRLLNTVAGVFERQSQPTLLVLEDLQWAQDSLSFIERLTQLVSTHPLLIIGSYRTDEDTGLPAALPTMQSMILPRLDEAAVRALCNSIIGSTMTDVLAQAVQQQTEGNLLFIVETLRALAEESGGLSHIGEKTLPAGLFTGGIRAVVQRRLRRVQAEYRPLLELAAVAGRRVDLPLLSALCPTLDVGRVLINLQQLSIFEPLADTWQFSHAKIREAILGAIESSHLVECHRQVAAALIVLTPNTDLLAATLAYHWRMAGNAEQEFLYAGLAGEQAVRSGAYQEAADYLQRSLFVFRQLPPNPAQHERALTLQLAFCSAQIASFGQSSPEVKAAYDQARALTDGLGDTPYLANALFGLAAYYSVSGQPDVALPLLEQTYSIGQRFNNLSITIQAAMSIGNLYFWQGKFAEAISRADEVLSAYQTAAEDLDVLRFAQNPRITCMNAKVWATWARGDEIQARQMALDTLALAEQLAQPFSIAIALQILALLGLMARDPALAGPFGERLQRYAEQFKIPLYMALGSLAAGWARTMPVDDAPVSIETVWAGLKQVQDAEATLNRMGARLLSALVSALLIELQQRVGNPTAALVLADDAIALAKTDGEQWNMAELYRLRSTLQDSPAAARQDILDAIAVAKAQGAAAFEQRASVALEHLT